MKRRDHVRLVSSCTIGTIVIKRVVAAHQLDATTGQVI
jgi:hypothetical protein